MCDPQRHTTLVDTLLELVTIYETAIHNHQPQNGTVIDAKSIPIAHFLMQQLIECLCTGINAKIQLQSPVLDANHWYAIQWWHFVHGVAVKESRSGAFSLFLQDYELVSATVHTPYKGLVWIRLALNQHLLSDYLMMLVRHTGVVRACFDDTVLITCASCQSRLFECIQRIEQCPVHYSQSLPFTPPPQPSPPPGRVVGAGPPPSSSSSSSSLLDVVVPASKTKKKRRKRKTRKAKVVSIDPSTPIRPAAAMLVQDDHDEHGDVEVIAEAHEHEEDDDEDEDDRDQPSSPPPPRTPTHDNDDDGDDAVASKSQVDEEQEEEEKTIPDYIDSESDDGIPTREHAATVTLDNMPPPTPPKSQDPLPPLLPAAAPTPPASAVSSYRPRSLTVTTGLLQAAAEQKELEFDEMPTIRRQPPPLHKRSRSVVLANMLSVHPFESETDEFTVKLIHAPSCPSTVPIAGDLPDYFGATTSSSSLSSSSLLPPIRRRVGRVLFVQLDLAPPQVTPYKQLRMEQSSKCPTCDKRIKISFARGKRCYYTDRFYCDECFAKEKYPLPQYLVHKSDYNRYPVCGLAAEYLRYIYAVPCIPLMDANPTLYEKSKRLQQVHECRKTLMSMKPFIMTCPAKSELLKVLGDQAYLYTTSIDMYSIRCLVRMLDGSLIRYLRLCVLSFDEHCRACRHCMAKAWVCLFCHDDSSVLYPFDATTVTTVCDACGACYHNECYRTAQSCPKCSRK